MTEEAQIKEAFKTLSEAVSTNYEKRFKVVDHVFKFFTWLIVSDGILLFGQKSNDWMIMFIGIAMFGLIVWCYVWQSRLISLWMIEGIPIRYMNVTRYRFLTAIVLIMQAGLMLEIVRIVHATLMSKAI